MRFSSILRLYRVRLRARFVQELFAIAGIAVGARPAVLIAGLQHQPRRLCAGTDPGDRRSHALPDHGARLPRHARIFDAPGSGDTGSRSDRSDARTERHHHWLGARALGLPRRDRSPARLPRREVGQGLRCLSACQGDLADAPRLGRECRGSPRCSESRSVLAGSWSMRWHFPT